MSATDVAPVVARIVSRIQTVADIGLVHGHDVWSREDMHADLVSPIGGVDTLRAWWVTGPTMTGDRLTQTTGGRQERRWTYTVTGVEGLDETGSCVDTLRANALAVTDALDLDPTLGNTCHRTWPCTWPQEPEFHVLAGIGIAVALVRIALVVSTVSTP